MEYDPNRTIVPFTEAERFQKREADLFYRHGDYRRAISIVTSMIRLNRELEYDPGCIGLLMFAYHKLQDWKDTAVYALKKIELSEGNDPISHSIAAVAFYYLGDFDKALYHIGRTLELENNSSSHTQANLRIAIYSAARLNRWSEIAFYAKQYLELDPEHEEILRIGFKAAQKSWQFHDVLYFAELMLAKKETRHILEIAMRAAWACKDATKTLEYAERLILQADVTECEEFLIYAKRAAQELGCQEKVQRYSTMLRAAQGLRRA